MDATGARFQDPALDPAWRPWKGLPDGDRFGHDQLLSRRFGPALKQIAFVPRQKMWRLTAVVPFLVEDELVRLGGHYTKAGDGQPCAVIDGNLVTGQNPASAAGVAEGLLLLLRSTKE